MFCINMILIIIFIPVCVSDIPYLLRSYPSDSIVTQTSFTDGPCVDSTKTLSFLQGTDNASLYHSECIHNSDDSSLICKLGLGNASLLLNLDNYPLDNINVLILFVQEFSSDKLIPRVLDLCFINRFGKSLRELAICGYQPPLTGLSKHKYLHILDIPALAIVASNIQTLLISGVNLWQSVELRQFSSLKHLLIIQGRTIQMKYYHSPFCADCEGAHPTEEFSFHYLIPLSSQLTYFLYDSPLDYKSCKYDLLKKIRSSSTISTFIVASNTFFNNLNEPICQTCASGLCPLLSICLDDNSVEERRNKNQPFECLCVEEIKVENEFLLCNSMSLHQPMYSTRCNHTPSFWKYVTRSMIIVTIYILCSIIVFICSTIFLMKTK